MQLEMRDAHTVRPLQLRREQERMPAGHNVAVATLLIQSRRNTTPRRLVEPGPDDSELATLFRMASAAPDHARLMPWRFVVVPKRRRALLAEAFALALVDRDPNATLAQIEAAREKAYRAPLLMIAIVRLVSEREPGIPDAERLVSLGCAIQNILLTATSMGYGSGLTSGQAMPSDRMRKLFGLQTGEQAVCFVNIGTALESRARPARAVTPAIATEL